MDVRTTSPLRPFTDPTFYQLTSPTFSSIHSPSFFPTPFPIIPLHTSSIHFSSLPLVNLSSLCLLPVPTLLPALLPGEEVQQSDGLLSPPFIPLTSPTSYHLSFPNSPPPHFLQPPIHPLFPLAFPSGEIVRRIDGLLLFSAPSIPLHLITSLSYL